MLQQVILARPSVIGIVVTADGQTLAGAVRDPT